MLRYNASGGGADINLGMSVPTSQFSTHAWQPIVGRWHPLHCRSFEQGTTLRDAPDWAIDAVYYQLNIQFFTPEGTFSAALPRLEHLSKLGVTAIVLTPIAESRSPGTSVNSSRNQIFYGVRRPDMIDASLGGPNGLIAFVTRAHELGLHVVVDNVPNGLRRDSPYLPSSPDFCGGADVLRRNSSGGYVIAWGANVELDWSSKALRDWWTAEIGLKWVQQYGIDGFRCDCEPNYGSTPLWAAMRQTVFDATGKRILIMSETNPIWGQASDRGFAFHLTQHDYDSHDITQHPQPPRPDDWFYGNSGHSFVDAVKLCGEPLATRTLSNHDYTHYAVQGQFASFVYGTIISPFSPHWFSGEETNQTRNLLVGGTGVLYFQQIDWREAAEPAASTLVARVASMLRVRKECGELFGPSQTGAPINRSVQVEELPTIVSKATGSWPGSMDGSLSVLPAYMFWRSSTAVFVLANRQNPPSNDAREGNIDALSQQKSQPQQYQQIVNITSFPQLVQKLHRLRPATLVEVVDLERRSVVDGPKPLANLAQQGFAYAIGVGDAAVLLVRPAVAADTIAGQQQCGAAIPRVADASSE